MTELIVSVQNAAEAQLALSAGARMIDVKDPGKGSLGAAAPSVWRQVTADANDFAGAEEIAGADKQFCISVALGELADHSGKVSSSDLKGISFVKLGLSEMGLDDQWLPRVRGMIEQLPPNTDMVAVVYGDWQSCRGPDVDAVIDGAVQTGCRGLLFDTFDKDGRTLFDHFDCKDLKRWITALREIGLFSCIAGSLQMEDIPTALSLAPDFVAVRSAVCSDSKNRASRIDPARIQTLRTAIAATASKDA